MSKKSKYNLTVTLIGIIIILIIIWLIRRYNYSKNVNLPEQPPPDPQGNIPFNPEYTVVFTY